MKKILKYIFLFLIIIPVYINASSNYYDSVDISQKYISKFEQYNNYLKFSNNLPWEYDGTRKIDNSSFMMGGFLNTWEYKVTANSSFSNTSYLAPGIGYWLVSNGKPYNYLDIKLEKTSDELLLETRVCEFVKKNAIVDGKGTYGDPWTFKKGHLITIASNSLLYGKTSPSVIEYVNTDDVSEIAVIPNANYHYDDSDCVNNSKDVASYSIKNNVITIKNVIDDVKCTINFIPNEYKITLNKNGGSGGTDILYELYSVAFCQSNGCKKESNIAKITIPTKAGYRFDGYYTSTSGGTKLIDASGTITNELSTKLFKSDSTIYAQWKPSNYTITFNCNFDADATTKGGSMSNVTAQYDSNVILGVNKCYQIKTGNPGRIYSFKGWSTSSGGSVIYNDGAVVKQTEALTDDKLTLYAVWSKINVSGKVTNLGDGDWYIKFTSNTNFKPDYDMEVNAFLVGGGKPGNVNGVGGAGGTVVNSTVKLNAGQNYSISIGGSGVSTTAFGLTATSGGGSAGSSNSAKGVDGVYPFGDSNLEPEKIQYGAGGGHGEYCTVDSGNSTRCKNESKGGATGGGNGYGAGGSKNGVANTGGGGGGGDTGHNGGHGGGTGGSGVVIIRNSRNVIVNGKVYGKFSGTYTTFKDSSNKWYIKFLSTGIFTPNQNISINTFLVAGGKSGGSNGSGGAGGGVKTVNNINLSANTAYTINVGQSDKDTSAFGYSVSSGSGSAAGQNGTPAFNNISLDGIYYGAGGGAGENCWYDSGNSVRCKGGSVGGNTGAGRGYFDGKAATNGQVNTGAGGGGSDTGAGTIHGAGAGGSGIVIVRLN